MSLRSGAVSLVVCELAMLAAIVPVWTCPMSTSLHPKLEVAELAPEDLGRDVERRDGPDRAAKGPEVRVGVHDEVGPVLADRVGQRVGAQPPPQVHRLAMERRRR